VIEGMTESTATEMLARLKRQYRNESAILDYIEMIGCEIAAMDENARCNLP
jgi:hypothetical protein